DRYVLLHKLLKSGSLYTDGVSSWLNQVKEVVTHGVTLLDVLDAGIDVLQGYRGSGHGCTGWIKHRALDLSSIVLCGSDSRQNGQQSEGAHYSAIAGIKVCFHCDTLQSK